MAIAKTIELVAESKTSWEDAAKKAVKEAGKTVKNITGIWIADQKAVVKGNKITHYRIHCKITFVVK